MRLVVFSDLHLDHPFAWAPPEVARRRRRALRDTLTNVVALADEVDADLLCCAGDLYEHDRFTPDTRAFVRDTLAGAGRPVYLAPGNHDWWGPTSLYASVDWPERVHVFTAPELQPVPLAEGLTLWGAAHCRESGTGGFLDAGFTVDRGGLHLALFHGSERAGLAVEGADKHPHAPFTAEQIPAAGLHHALVGHFHTPRDADHHTYPGNPDPLTFGETGERGAVVVEVTGDGGVHRERRRVGVSAVHDLCVDVTGCGSGHEVRDRVAEALIGLEGCVRVTLTGELAPEVEVDLDAVTDLARDDRLEAVVARTDLRVGYDLDRIAAERTVRGQFVRDVRDAGLAEDEQRRVLATGLRALDGRDDLEVV